MRWLLIARKDVGDSIRGRRLHVLVGIFTLLGAATGYLSDTNVGEGLVLLLAFLAPLVGLGFTQDSIVTKRAGGELTVLLGLPFARREILLGTYLGRTAVLVAALVGIYVGAAVFALLSGTSFSLATMVGGFLLVAVLGTIFVSIALGISAATESTTVASAGAFGAFLVFVFQLWRLIPDGILYLLNGFSLPPDRPTWAAVFDQLSPFAGVRNLTAGFSSDLAAIFPVVAESVPADPPVYMEPWFGALVTIAWLVVPAALGYRSFERSDL